MPKPIEAEIVNELLDDLTDRRAFDAIWAECDADVQAEIRTAWEHIIREALKRRDSTGKAGA